MIRSKRVSAVMIGVVACALGVSACGPGESAGTGGPASASPRSPTSQAPPSVGAPPKTFEDVYDMRSAIEAASGDGTELDCEDSFRYRINGEGGTSVVCSLPDRPDGAHEVIRLVTCPTGVECVPEVFLGIDSDMRDPGMEKESVPAYCYLPGNGNWAVGALLDSMDGRVPDCDAATRFMTQIRDGETVKSAVTAQPVDTTGPVTRPYGEGTPQVVITPGHRYSPDYDGAVPVDATGTGTTIWKSDQNTVKVCEVDAPSSATEGRSYLETCLASNPFTADAQRLADGD